MAWELAYTSVASGPTGRSGFQFVAASPGVPPEVPRLVTPYMTYRPPPGAPAAPAEEELAAFPTAFAYGREGGYLVLARCHYTGRDYSGRYGNFLGRALVATPEEMEGLRPIGDAHWQSTGESGDPTIDAATNGPMGTIRSGTLERSNVDITEELVMLIGAQRNFQANAKAIEGASTLTQTIINMRT